MEKHNIISKHQYGFQRNKSTEHAIIDIHERILQSIEKKETPCCVFLDFAKAFDTVNHRILLHKLEHYGIRGLGSQLLQSYLSNRQQCVSINGENSKLLKVQHGVPQGSILGPLLFLLYINDICESSTKLSFFLFADDTTLFFSDPDIKVVKETLNQELLKVSDWLKANKLSLNVKKTNVLLFKTSRRTTANDKFEIVLNGTVVEEKKSAKYLGVYIDNKLMFDGQRKHVLTRLQKSNAILAKTRHFVPKSTLRNIYFAHFQSHLDYGLPVWGHALKSHVKPILKSQKKAVRLINFQSPYSSNLGTLFTENKILTLKKCLAYKTSQLIWKAWKNTLPSNIQQLFKKLENLKLFKPSRRINLTQNCTSYAGVKMWNNIPSQIRNIPSYLLFKAKIKEYLLRSP